MPSNRHYFDIVRHPLVIRPVSVARTEAVMPNIRRIVFCGEALQGFASLAPEDHVRQFVLKPGEIKPKFVNANETAIERIL